MQTRDGLTIRGEFVPHNIAARDWYCACGSKVVTRWYKEQPHWRSVCYENDEHNPDDFIHTKALAYEHNRTLMGALVADDVFAHLDEEAKELIRKGGTDGN